MSDQRMKRRTDGRRAQYRPETSKSRMRRQVAQDGHVVLDGVKYVRAEDVSDDDE